MQANLRNLRNLISPTVSFNGISRKVLTEQDVVWYPVLLIYLEERISRMTIQCILVNSAQKIDCNRMTLIPDVK